MADKEQKRENARRELRLAAFNVLNEAYWGDGKFERCINSFFLARLRAALEEYDMTHIEHPLEHDTIWTNR